MVRLICSLAEFWFVMTTTTTMMTLESSY